jgi:hypothetical protein
VIGFREPCNLLRALMGAASTGTGEFCRELVATSRRPAPVEATDFYDRATGYICSIPERDMASVTIRTARKLGAHTRASANESDALDPGPRRAHDQDVRGGEQRDRGTQLLFPPLTSTWSTHRGETMKPTQRLSNLGQSLWLDSITRPLLTSGSLKRYIEKLSGTGLTSNRPIFDHVIKNAVKQ